jgi:hypothetical protein
MSDMRMRTNPKKAAEQIAAITYASLLQFPEKEQQKRIKESKK